MGLPKRLTDQKGFFSLVDHIPYRMPIACHDTPALMAVFSINAEKAKSLIPGKDVHPYRLWNKGLLVITVINYVDTVIGKYIEYSIAIACTKGKKPAPRFIPALDWEHFGLGQYVYDLPVSSEISVKGGKGIWGMPKHQANLDFIIGEKTFYFALTIFVFFPTKKSYRIIWERIPPHFNCFHRPFNRKFFIWK